VYVYVLRFKYYFVEIAFFF